MDTDVLDRRLKDALAALVGAAFPDPEFPGFESVERRAQRVQRRRQLAAGVGVAATLVAAFLIVRDPGLPEVETGPAPATEVPVSLDPNEAALPKAPLDVRGDAAVVWTGSELVVWGGDVEAADMGLPGGDRSYADGAAYNPAERSWRPLSEGPLPNSFDLVKGVRVDAGVVFVRGTATALWDPREDSWRALDDAPASVEDLVSTGQAALSYSANARLDVGTGQWTQLPDAPERLERPSVAWTGDELVVVGGLGTPFTRPTAVIYNPDQDAWRTAAPAPELLTAAALAAGWDGRRVVVVDYDMGAVTYDPTTDSWDELPPVPARFSEWYPSLVAQPGATMAFMSQAVAVLTEQDTWVPLPYGSVPDGTPATTESGVVFVWGLDSDADRNVLGAFSPADLANTPESLQVGIASIRIPSSYQLNDASVIGAATAVEGVRVELTAARNSCTVTSTYFGIDGPVLDQPVAETLENEPEPQTWHRSDDQRIWQAPATDSDRFQIECDDPQTARALALSAGLPVLPG